MSIGPVEFGVYLSTSIHASVNLKVLGENLKPDRLVIHEDLVAGCHGVEGQGIPHVVVPLATNSSLKLTSPRNLIRAILQGIPAQRFPGLERMQPVPGFGPRWRISR